MSENRSKRNRGYWERGLVILMGLYLGAILTSMAGMSIFSALIFFVFVFVLTSFRHQNPPVFSFFKLGVEIPLGLLLFAILVSAIQTAGLSREALKIISRIHWVPWLYILTYVLFTLRKEVAKLWWLIPITAAIAIYAIIQHFTGIDLLRSSQRAVQPMGSYWRSAGFYGSPMSYGYIFGVISCFILAGSLGLPQQWAQSRWLNFLRLTRNRWWLAAVFIVVSISLFTTLTRGVWLSAALAYAVMLGIANRRALLGFGILLFLSVLLLSSDGAYYGRIHSIFSFQNGAHSERFQIWAANLEMFKDHFLFGVGYGENERILGSYYAKMGIQNGFMGHAHNSFMQFLSGTGSVGFIGFCWFLFYTLMTSYKLYKKTTGESHFERILLLGIIGSIVFMIFGSLTEATFQDSETTHAYAFIFALLFCIKEHRRQMNLA